MPTIAAELDAAFRSAIAAALGTQADPQISIAQNPKFGDYQSNAAMGLAKAITEKSGQRTNPRAVAEQIVAKLSLGAMASEVSIAGPGFINVKLSSRYLGERLSVAAGDDRLGVAPAEHPLTVVVDYSGPNVSKQMHVGHLRPTNIGDAVSRILEFAGHTVIRQNHIGDWGTSFGMLLAHLKTTPAADADAQIADLESFYRQAKVRFDNEPGFADLSREMVVRLQGGGAEETALWQRIVEQSRKHFEAIYEQLGVRLTRADERGESFYNAELPKVVKELTERGVAVESEGAIVVWVEGFEAPLMVRKSGGGFGYATTDLAAVRFRVETLHADWIIYTTDARQAQHFKQFFDAAGRAGWLEHVRVDHITFGTILGPDGKPFKSKSGDNVKMKELLDEAEARALAVVEAKNPELPAEKRQAIARAVGIGAIKYYDLARDWLGNYVFDWEKILALDGNTAPYLQYAYARICSIFRRARERDIAMPGIKTQIELAEPAEVQLALHLLRLQETLATVNRDLKPHVLCTYLYDLATLFSRFFESCPVLQSAEPVRGRRLALCDIAARTLGLGLDLLGIEHPEQMQSLAHGNLLFLEQSVYLFRKTCQFTCRCLSFRWMPPKTIDTASIEFGQAIGLLVRRVRAAAASQELSLTESAVLARLAKEGPATTAELARAEGMKPQSMGATIAALEERGLLERKPHPTDGRQVNIVLTARGIEVRENTRTAKRTWLAEAIAKLEPREREMLFAAGKIISRLAEK